MRAVERVSFVELFRFLQFLYKNINFEITFPVMEIIKAKDRIAQKLLCFTHDLDTKHQR